MRSEGGNMSDVGRVRWPVLVSLLLVTVGCGDTHHHYPAGAADGGAPSGAGGESPDGTGGSGGDTGAADEDQDADGDGFSAADGDCDDADKTAFPGATDSAVDGVDQDCDGVDGPDADGDGVAAASAGGTDCDDNDGSVYPGATDLPGDGVDQDCDGVFEGERVEETAVLSEIVLDYRAYCAAGIYALTPWDWDGDGYEDLVVSDGHTARSYILHNAGAWSLGWTSPRQYSGPSYYASSSSNFGYSYQFGLGHLGEDWDEDGREELLLVGGGRDAYAWDGTLFRRTDGLGVDSGGGNMAVASFDWDGVAPREVVFGGQRHLAVSHYDGVSLSTVFEETPYYPGFTALSVADYDGDGREEVLLGNSHVQYHGSWLRLLDFDGSTTPTRSWSDGEGGGEVYALRKGDVDNDGDTDFLSLGRSGAWLYTNDGTGSFAVSWIAPEAVDFASGVLADVNHDGWLDIVLPSELRRFSVYLNDGAGGFVDAIHDFHGQGRAVAVHDFDGDGLLDISFVAFEHAGVTDTGRDTCTVTTVAFAEE